MLIGAGGNEVAGRGDNIGGDEVVTSQAVHSGEIAEATSESEAGDSGCGDGASRGCQSEGLRFMIVLAPQHPALGTGTTRARVDPNRFHRREVDHQAVVAYGGPCHIVTAAPDCDRQAVCLGKPNRGLDVGNARDFDDGERTFVDHCIPDLARLIVSLTTAHQDLAAEGTSQLFHRFGTEIG